MLLQLPSLPSTGTVESIHTDWLHCEDLSLDRDGRPVLDRLHLRCRRDEWLALVDPVGATASALLTVIEGRGRPQRGRLSWPTGRPAMASVLGQLQWPAGLTLRQLPLALGLPIPAAVWAAHGLERRLDWPLIELSPLESRLVQLLCAEAAPARLLVLDDPLHGLDAEARRVFLAAMQARRARWPQTLWRVPEFDGLEACCERRVDLDLGRVCADRRLPLQALAGPARRPAVRPDRSQHPVPQRDPGPRGPIPSAAGRVMSAA